MPYAKLTATLWSVRTYLVWLVIACLLPGALGAAVLFTFQYREGQAQLERNTLQTVRALVQAVDGQLLRTQAVAQVLATSEALRRNDLEAFHREAREIIAITGLGTNVVLRDETGRQLLNTVLEYGRPLSPAAEPAQVARVFATGQPTVSNLFYGPVQHRPLMSVDVPVRRDGRIVLALGVGIVPAQINEVLRLQNLPPEWIVGVFDADAITIARTLDPDRYVGQPGSAGLREAMARSNEGAAETDTLEGMPVTSYFGFSRMTGWRVAIGIPLAEQKKAFEWPLLILAFGILILFGISLLLAGLIGGRIAHSVTSLMAPTMALVGRGFMAAPNVDVREAAQVAKAIERTAALLKERDAVLRDHEEALLRSERTARESAGQAEAERRRLDAVLDASPVGIVVADAIGALMQANAEHRRLWGVHTPPTSNESALQQWQGWWADGARAGQRLTADEWPMTRALRGESVAGDVIEIESFDVPTQRRIILMSSSPIRDAKRRIIGGVLAQMDITGRVRAEQALQLADRRKDEFLAMLAHELRNPLAPISAAAELIGMGRLDAAQLQRTSAVIARQVKHMTGLIEDLLDVSRVTRGLVTIEPVRLDVRQVVADAVEQARPLIEARRHQFELQLPDEEVCVAGDAKRLVQVVANLLNNAAKFTPDGGQIRVEVSLRQQDVCIAISDNGVGMSPTLLQSAFELFAQGERTPERAQGGLGIGLALVRSLVEMHGGSVDAYSAGPGQGSRFEVCLPRQFERRSGPPPAPAAPPGTLKRRLLIVDDNADAAQMLAMLAVSHGHVVHVESAPDAALAVAPEFKPDVCLLDIGLPGMDGYELARHLRALPATAHALLVAVTGYGQEQDRQRTRAAGFDHHLTKPVDAAALLALLGGSSA